MSKQPSLLGGAMIITGTVVGAGMLANPTATSGVWFLGSLLVLLYTWFSMLTSGLMILEVNTHYPSGASFDTLVRDLLGKGWNIVNGMAVAFVLYLLTYAYIFVGSNLTTAAIGLNPAENLWVGQMVFFLIFAGCVWWSARVVDRFTSVLIGGMILTFIWATSGLLSTAKIPVLLDSAAPADTRYWIYAGTALPVCLASFGFHGNVSSLFKYFDGDAPKVARALWIGTLIALVIYALWQLAIHGNLPRSAFTPVIAADGDIGVLIGELSKFASTGSMAKILSFFSYMAIASSFLGVTLGLLDYLTDLFGFDNSRSGRNKAAAITFLPPLVACLLFPTGFVTVIGYVGLAATVWTGLVPALLLYASRKKHGLGKGYRVYGGTGLVIWVFVFGVINILAQLLSRADILPVFKG
ncbi:aromatic amino acid transporter [Kingella negevensis]|uniref:Aromatic amino acid permease n=1 Tax=Kingella negevensis TaxID=1522312 RepID=A0A238HIX0_9NEIS|nr:aromatic amino acid transporter [Kingella negevensis]MDK4684614.1 aromatic amino acid transporter [Kingella negevensis]MDK4696943.1 aromatic amino acid transporter [Kingella negevensis]MDK4708123.1 aromatic amino acid transporter [Kingella negevensis]MDK4709688.1 aromatic amino acid transporter [Kingella negevensis]SNB78084.1 Tryptophan-specific transport protein [Kingella negevensis]